MLQGQYEPQTQAGKLDASGEKSPAKQAGPVKLPESKTDANQTPDKDEESSQKNKEHRGTVVSDDNTNPYQTVSYDGQSESAGQARGPVPVVPRPRGSAASKSNKSSKSTDAGKSNHVGREEKKNRSQQEAEDDPEDNTLSDRVFRAPTLTRPVSDDERSGKEAPASDQNGSIKKNSASGDDSGADESGTPDSDNADGYVSVIEPGRQAQLATQHSGIRLTSGSLSPVYGPVGSKGTIPMNFERPSYGR